MSFHVLFYLLIDLVELDNHWQNNNENKEYSVNYMSRKSYNVYSYIRLL